MIRQANMATVAERPGMTDERPRLSRGDVDIWWGDLSRCGNESADEHLSPEERRRAGRFLRPAERIRYLFAHAMLRRVLSCYLEADPGEIAFRRNPFGKPELDRQTDLRFNLAHSHDVAVVAVTCGSEVGVDVEYVREVEEGGMIVDSIFSADERTYHRHVAPDVFRQRFFTCWTLKEAFIKAVGQGLSFPLNGFSVVDGGSILGETAVRQELSAARWYQLSFSPDPAYMAAVVLQHSPPLPRFLSYDELLAGAL